MSLESVVAVPVRFQARLKDFMKQEACDRTAVVQKGSLGTARDDSVHALMVTLYFSFLHH